MSEIRKCINEFLDESLIDAEKNDFCVIFHGDYGIECRKLENKEELRDAIKELVDEWEDEDEFKGFMYWKEVKWEEWIVFKN